MIHWMKVCYGFFLASIRFWKKLVSRFRSPAPTQNPFVLSYCFFLFFFEDEKTVLYALYLIILRKMVLGFLKCFLFKVVENE